MSKLMAKALPDDGDALSWEVYIWEESGIANYWGIRVNGEKKESLKEVIVRACALHKACMIVSGRKATPIIHAEQYDQHGQMIKLDPSIANFPFL